MDFPLFASQRPIRWVLDIVPIEQFFFQISSINIDISAEFADHHALDHGATSSPKCVLSQALSISAAASQPSLLFVRRELFEAQCLCVKASVLTTLGRLWKAKLDVQIVQKAWF